MKKSVWKLRGCKIAALVCAVLLLLPLGACGDVTEDTTPSESSTEAPAGINFFGEGSLYEIIRDETAGKSVVAEYVRLKKVITEATGADLPLHDDWVRSEAEIGAYEILFGDTNRPETGEIKPLLEGKGFVLAVKNGKLIIYASTNKAYTSAVTYIEEELLGKGIYTLEEGYFYTAAETANITGVTVNGVPLQDYTVVVPSLTKYNQPIYTAERFFSKYCGVSVTTVAESTPVEGHRLIIGGTKADGSAYDTFEIEIYYKDGDLHLGCAGISPAEQVLYTFFAKYLDGFGKVDIVLPDDGTPVYHLNQADNWDEANPKCLTVQDRIVRGCYKLQEILEYDHSRGLYFTYQGELGYKSTIAASREATDQQSRTTNCVIVGNWVMKDAGFYTSGIYNHTYDGSFGWTVSGGAGDFFKEYMDVIDVRSENKSAQTLTREERLLPGDIIGFHDHNQTILPNGYAFDGGRSSQNMVEARTGGKFRQWVGPNPYPGMTVGFIARAKDAE